MGHTSIKTNTVVSSIAAAEKADCVLTIDSANCSNHANLYGAIQLADAGLRTHKNDEYMNQSTIEKSVISIGEPTVIHANRLAPDAEALGDGFLTVTDIENVVKRAVLIIASSVLRAAYPDLDYQSSRMIAEETSL